MALRRTLVLAALPLFACSGATPAIDASASPDAGATDAASGDSALADAGSIGPADTGARVDAGAGCTSADLPTATSVGIPADAPPLTVVSDSLHTDHDGQIFDAIDFQARLYVDHHDVVIRRSRLVGDVYYAVYSTVDGPLTIEDSEILGGVLAPDSFVARRNYVHAPSGGERDDGFIFAASHVLIEDNRIEGLVGGDGAHVDGIQIMAGVDVVLRHNWIDASSPPISGGGVNAAVFFAPDMGEIRDVVVECNELIARDAYYPLRIDSGGSVIVRHNRWGRGHLGNPYLLSDTTTVAEWTDNQYDDGEVIAGP